MLIWFGSFYRLHFAIFFLVFHHLRPSSNRFPSLSPLLMRVQSEEEEDHLANLETKKCGQGLIDLTVTAEREKERNLLGKQKAVCVCAAIGLGRRREREELGGERQREREVGKRAGFDWQNTKAKVNVWPTPLGKVSFASVSWPFLFPPSPSPLLP